MLRRLFEMLSKVLTRSKSDNAKVGKNILSHSVHWLGFISVQPTVAISRQNEESVSVALPTAAECANGFDLTTFSIYRLRALFEALYTFSPQ